MGQTLKEVRREGQRRQFLMAIGQSARKHPLLLGAPDFLVDVREGGVRVKV